MTALLLAAAAGTAEGNPLQERIPDNTTPGVIFVIIVIGSMIAFLVWVWIKNFGPGAAPPEGAEN
jgi:hypothetical protein